MRKYENNERAGGMPAAHGVDGRDFGSVVSYVVRGLNENGINGVSDFVSHVSRR